MPNIEEWITQIPIVKKRRTTNINMIPLRNAPVKSSHRLTGKERKMSNTPLLITELTVIATVNSPTNIINWVVALSKLIRVKSYDCWIFATAVPGVILS
jgi:hypothetical protein